MTRAAPAFGVLASALAFTLTLTGCATVDWSGPSLNAERLEVLLEVDDQPTGVAVSSTGRIFVSFPSMRRRPDSAVVELLPDGTTRPFPDRAWTGRSGSDTRRRFVCAQSLSIDADDRLWVLDAGREGWLGGVLEGGAKLVEIDLARDEVVRVIALGASVAPKNSFLNDVRVDPDRGVAFVTDAGLGALIVVDLETGAARRRLDGDPSVLAESGCVPVVAGAQWRTFFGIAPRVHVDGLALDASAGWVYFHALCGKTLYRVSAAALVDATLDGGLDEELAERVEPVAITGPCDGMRFGHDGSIYLAAIEENGITRWRDDGEHRLLVQDPSIQWPDSIAETPSGDLLFTVSQIHFTAPFNWGIERLPQRFRLMRFRAPHRGSIRAP